MFVALFITHYLWILLIPGKFAIEPLHRILVAASKLFTLISIYMTAFTAVSHAGRHQCSGR